MGKLAPEWEYVESLVVKNHTHKRLLHRDKLVRTKNEERQKKEGTIIPSPSPSTITKGEQANINVRPHTATIHPTKKPKLV